jgi:hypothetical protein
MEKWRKMYNAGWCNEEQLRLIVQRGGISEQEYEEITGESYSTEQGS